RREYPLCGPDEGAVGGAVLQAAGDGEDLHERRTYCADAVTSPVAATTCALDTPFDRGRPAHMLAEAGVADRVHFRDRRRTGRVGAADYVRPGGHGAVVPM
ncbi:MAG: hypothetical protein LC799_09335, partial [Actinobacteria bacterium]|nr:hypothetical protein [Actinomycetota bacterium]